MLDVTVRLAASSDERARAPAASECAAIDAVTRTLEVQSADVASPARPVTKPDSSASRWERRAIESATRSWRFAARARALHGIEARVADAAPERASRERVVAAFRSRSPRAPASPTRAWIGAWPSVSAWAGAQRGFLPSPRRALRALRPRARRPNGSWRAAASAARGAAAPGAVHRAYRRRSDRRRVARNRQCRVAALPPWRCAGGGVRCRHRARAPRSLAPCRHAPCLRKVRVRRPRGARRPCAFADWRATGPAPCRDAGPVRNRAPRRSTPSIASRSRRDRRWHAHLDELVRLQRDVDLVQHGRRQPVLADMHDGLEVMRLGAHRAPFGRSECGHGAKFTRSSPPGPVTVTSCKVTR